MIEEFRRMLLQQAGVMDPVISKKRLKIEKQNERIVNLCLTWRRYEA